MLTLIIVPWRCGRVWWRNRRYIENFTDTSACGLLRPRIRLRQDRKYGLHHSCLPKYTFGLIDKCGRHLQARTWNVSAIRGSVEWIACRPFSSSSDNSTRCFLLTPTTVMTMVRDVSTVKSSRVTCGCFICIRGTSCRDVDFVVTWKFDRKVDTVEILLRFSHCCWWNVAVKSMECKLRRVRHLRCPHSCVIAWLPCPSTVIVKTLIFLILNKSMEGVTR